MPTNDKPVADDNDTATSEDARQLNRLVQKVENAYKRVIAAEYTRTNQALRSAKAPERMLLALPAGIESNIDDVTAWLELRRAFAELDYVVSVPVFDWWMDAADSPIRLHDPRSRNRTRFLVYGFERGGSDFVEQVYLKPMREHAAKVLALIQSLRTNPAADQSKGPSDSPIVPESIRGEAPGHPQDLPHSAGEVSGGPLKPSSSSKNDPKRPEKPSSEYCLIEGWSVRWEGTTELQPIKFRLLKAILEDGRALIPLGDIEDRIWYKSEKPTIDKTKRNAVTGLNGDLEKIGWPYTYGVRGGCIVRDEHQ